MKTFSLHVAIVSWAGKYEEALAIAEQVVAVADRVTVVYSSPTDDEETGPGDWVQVENDLYFGPKFSNLIKRNDEDLFFLIQADAFSSQWPAVLASCKSAFEAHNDIGVWAPVIDYSPYTKEQLRLMECGGPTLVDVMLHDAIACCYHRKIAKHLASLDYSANNLGWGIDRIACASSALNGLRVVCETSIVVYHPRSRGYCSGEAERQMDQFIAQMSAAEQRIIAHFVINHKAHVQFENELLYWKKHANKLKKNANEGTYLTTPRLMKLIFKRALGWRARRESKGCLGEPDWSLPDRGAYDAK